MRDSVTGELALGPHVLIVATQPAALAVLRDCDRFRQWDGSFVTARGDVVMAGEATSEKELGLLESQSSLYPDTEGGGPFGFAQTPIFLDRPRHTRFRRLLVKDWAIDAAVLGLEPGFRQLAQRLLAGPRSGVAFEFMSSVAAPLSAGVLASFFGGSAAAWTELTLEHPAIWGKTKGHGEGTELLVAFQRHIWNELQNRARAPGDDSMSRMIAHSQAGDGLTLAEVQTLVLQMAVVANESMIRMLGSVAAALATDPCLRRRLAGDRHATEEFQATVLRACPPVRGLFRRTAAPSSVCGFDIPAQRGVFIDLKLAGQDVPARNAAGPDAGRTADRDHLAFGSGIHRCPGARLAMTAGSVLADILCEIPALTICAEGLKEVPSGLLEGPSDLWLQKADRNG